MLVSCMVKIPTPADAYALTDAADLRALYRDWARSYDTAFSEAEGYQLPHAVALQFVMAGGKGPVLDAGAGTGLVAEHLVRHGISDIDGLDISPEMLEVATQKGVYRGVLLHDMGQATPLNRQHEYGGLVSAGTFTLGHAGPDDLLRLTGWCAPGALCVISVNSQHFVDAGFAATLARADTLCDLVQETVRIYDDRADTAHREATAELLTFRRC